MYNAWGGSEWWYVVYLLVTTSNTNYIVVQYNCGVQNIAMVGGRIGNVTNVLCLLTHSQTHCHVTQIQEQGLNLNRS